MKQFLFAFSIYNLQNIVYRIFNTLA